MPTIQYSTRSARLSVHKPFTSCIRQTDRRSDQDGLQTATLRLPIHVASVISVQSNKAKGRIAHRRLVTPHSGECHRPPRALGRHILPRRQANNAQCNRSCCIQPKSALSVSWSGHPSSTWVSPQTASWSVQPFFVQLTRVPSTHRQTDHATCDTCSNKLHL